MRLGYKAIILFGLVSLMGDVIYEGARSITPTFLGYLGVSAFIVGIIFSLGEFVSISFRIFSGIIADITRGYWLLYIVGYLLIIAIPLIGFTNIWWIAASLIILERLAKAIRSPSRDTLLSIISRDVGAGKTFGLHELLDQIGAVIGPLILGLILLYTVTNYRIAYSSLFIPYLMLVLFVLYTYYSLRGHVKKYISKPTGESLRNIFSRLSIKFKIYCIAVALNTMGLIHWSLILYQTKYYVAPFMAAFLYLLIQLVDASAAPLSGYLYDRIGRIILIIPFILSIIPSILTISGGWINLITAGIFFGLIYGMQESIYRAAVVDLSPAEYRGSAYGIFNTFYGLGFLVSGSIYGFILTSKLFLPGVLYAIIIEILAIILLIKSTR